MTKPLDGKVAVVTGAARNIGRAIALALAEDGASVVVTAKSSGAEVEAVAEEIRAAGGNAAPLLADLGDPDQVDALFAAIDTLHGRVDILVNNAAVRRETSLADIAFSEWREVMSSILDASFLCAQAASTRMGEGGRIINLGGLSAHAGASARAHVVSAKAGLVG